MKVLKPGFQTTEFLAVILVNVGTIAASLQGSLNPKWAAIAGAVSAAAYAVSRGLAKSGPTVPATPLPSVGTDTTK